MKEKLGMDLLKVKENLNNGEDFDKIPENLKQALRLFVESVVPKERVEDELLLLFEKVNSLERDAQVGRATRKAFKNGYTLIKGVYGPVAHEISFEEQLLEWDSL